MNLQAQFNPTDDFDGDGIINQLDFDDDNDGVPDELESPSCFYSEAEAKSIVSISSQFTSPDAYTVLHDGIATATFNFAAGTITVGSNIFTIEFPIAVQVSSIQVSDNITATAAARAKLYGSNDNVNYVDLSGTNLAISTTPINFIVNQNGAKYKYYKIQGEVSGTLATGNTIGEISAVLASPFVGSLYPKSSCSILNHFNLDADGDGCSDALEAGATKDITPNYVFSGPYGSNGLSDAVETAADNGVLNYTSQYDTYASNGALNFCNLYVSDSGKVFMDFNGDGIQSSHIQEPGVKNVTVRAYKPDGSFLDAITDSLGMYVFTGAQLPAGMKVRIEFINLPSGFFDGFKAGLSNTTIQFISTGVNDVSANLALSIPNHYSSTLNPYFAFVQYRRNNGAASEQTIWFLNDNASVNFVPAAALDATRSWSMPNVSGVGNFAIPTRYEVATQGEVGSTLGLAWNKRSDFLLAGAYMRGYADLGTNTSANGFGEGIIYKIGIDKTGATAATPSVWLDLETILGDDIAGTYIADAVYPGATIYGRTNTNPNKIGFTGLGMMKFTNDGTKLLVTNLKTLEVFVIPVNPSTGNPSVSSASDIKRFLLPTQDAPGSWAHGNPYRSILGLGIHPVTGRAYVSITCNGPALANLKGVIYSFDPNDNTPDSSDFVRELEIPLNIIRPATNPNISQWYDQVNHPWESMAAATTVYTNGNTTNSQNNQPWLGEIIFDALPDGTFGMSISERNRFHDVINSSFYVAGGPIYRATWNGGSWQLENNQQAGPLTSTVTWTFASASRAGSNTSATNRFYKYVGAEGTFGNGTIAHVPGSNEILAAAMDNVFYSGTSGVTWLNRITGERSRDARHIGDFTNNGFTAAPFTKSNNFGDLELLGEMPPLEIGNRVWLDDDKDGIQDPDETGIAGVQVNLYQGALLVGTVTTSSDGSYYFTNTNVNLNGANGLLPNTAYEIRIESSQVSLTGLTLTATNTDGTSNGDARDNDGLGLITSVISLTTGDYGQNNHTYDFGYQQAQPPLPACLGNYVWIDDNIDGLQNNDEVGVAGVTVTLFNGANQVVSSTITDAYGYYKFCPLDPGTYHVGFTLPANYVFTTINAGSNDSTDSDVSPATGITANYTLLAGDTNWTVDAGIHFQRSMTATVGDYVWYDVNKDGMQDVNESGVSGVSVTLYNALNEIVATTITDANGYYLFTNVTPGTYCVGFTPLVALVLTLNNGAVTDATNSDANPTTGKTQTFVVNAGDQITTIDAGLYSQNINLCGLGDKVWFDVNQNGIQDADERGVPGVHVILYGADGTTILGSTITNVFGNYIFNELNPGSYMVGFSNIPVGFVFTTTSGTDSYTNSDANTSTGKTTLITLSAGQLDMTWDAGIYTSSISLTNSLGDYVWYDDDKDGVQDASELGVPGVVVTLYDDLHNEQDQTSTNQQGFYLFPNLPNGNYYVGFSNLPLGYVLSDANTTTDLLDSDPDPSTGKTDTVMLTGNTHNRSLDAGINKGDLVIGLGSLGDLVWYDMNGNGLQDTNEQGVAGVSVTLYEQDGTTLINTTTTDALGNYIFTGLDAGYYVVGFTNLPLGFTISPKNADVLGIDGVVNSDVNAATQLTDVVALGKGEDKMTVDMGIVPNNTVASLGNYVWFDLNKDGLQDPTEPGVQGVTVTLYDNTNSAIRTTTTTANGFYLFAGLSPDTYSVGFSNLPDGYTLTTPNSDAAGINGTANSDADAGTGLTSTVTLVAGEYNPNLDAGIITNIVASVGDYVWFDSNHNGIQDANEIPVGGVLVTLVDNTNQPVASTITKPDGGYIFTNVIPGTYTMKFSQIPDGMDYTVQEVNNASNTGSNANPFNGLTPSFTVPAGSHNPTIDAGLTAPPLAGLGDYVWFDVNQNGLQEANELPVPGVLVVLFDNNGVDTLATTTTNGEGAYSFPNLEAGIYRVGFANYPLGYSQTIQTGNVNDSQNSDAGIDGKTAPVTLLAGEFNPNIDAGIFQGNPLSTDLTNFSAVDQACQVILHWNVSSVHEVSSFEVTRKELSTSSAFISIASIPVTSVSLKSFEYKDLTATKGDYEYRLIIHDIDGKETSSAIERIQLTCESEIGIQVFPNPVQDQLTVLLPAQQEQNYSIAVHDVAGRILFEEHYVIQENTLVKIPSRNWSSGVYELKVQSLDESVQVFSVVK
ncbi:MAG: T9SS type A sorting domain-containing protein [Chitinophagaceae bacterium]|nr:T9SS type A sorting domain-containing protein [Chitinophagaceae bacterium]